MVRYYCILGHNNCSSGGSWCNLLGRSLAKTWTLNIGSVVRLTQNQWIEKKMLEKKSMHLGSNTNWKQLQASKLQKLMSN